MNNKIPHRHLLNGNTMLSHRDIFQLYQALPATSSSCYLYGLVDHAGIPGLAKKLRQDRAVWISLFESTRQKSAIAVAPLLFQIEVVNDRIVKSTSLDWICERGTYTSSLIFLASPLSIQELTHRLTRRLDAVLSEDMDVLLRFFDPRIFEQLVSILPVEQKRAFLGVANCWWFSNRRGKLEQVNARFSDEDNLECPIRLTAAQEHALIEASEPDQVAELLQSGAPNEYESLPWPDRYDFIVRHTAAARRFGISATHELAQYCLLALLHGEHFSEPGSWRAVLQEVRAGKLNLGQAVARVEEVEDI